MLRIGIVGADSFHALAFSKLANLPPEHGGSGLSARVTMLWGETPQRAAFVASEAHIPTVVDDPAQMLDQVDAVMVVLRHGAQHCAAALPFLQRGLPTWVDKPFAIDLNEALCMVDTARVSGALLAGGSACKYAPDVLALRDDFRRLGEKKQVISAHLNFPGELDSPYGGLYFYGSHAVEILTTAFGPNIQSVKADVTGGNVIAIFKYENFAVSVNFAEVSQFYGTLYSPEQVITRRIDISSIYRQGFSAFVKGVSAGRAPEPMHALLRPVCILNALVKAAETGLETPVQRVSDQYL